MIDILSKISELWEVYRPLLPTFVGAFTFALLLTPAMGRLAAKVGAMDLPAYLRKRSDLGIIRNINMNIHPRLGGLAMAISILLILIITGYISSMSWGIIVGMLIIMVYGFIDDIKDLKFKYQLAGQFLAAAVVVVSGVSVYGIQVAGIQLNFHLFNQVIEIGDLIYKFVFPADILTILWIMAMINFVNWMSGMDGLNHIVTAIASFMILLMAIDSGNVVVAILVSTHLGANLGAAVYNYPPAYIFPGAIGEHLNGYLLAVLAMLSGSKLPLALITMAIPILDALWVISTRMYRTFKETKNPKEILLAATKVDTNHLHHRLMALGFGWKAILGIEVAITIILSAIGFALAGFRGEFVALLVIMSILLILIAIIYSISKKREANTILESRIRPQPKQEEPTIEVSYGSTEETEEKFVY